AELPFNDAALARGMVREAGSRRAAVVVEPLVVSEPSREWLETLRAETRRAGGVLVFDELKTAFRIAIGGAAERWGVQPDLAVLGKALANGFPLAVVGGRAELMEHAHRTWISSTLATEAVALAAAQATLAVFEREQVCEHLQRVGTRLFHGLHRLQRDHVERVVGVGGVAAMSFLQFASEDVSRAVAVGCSSPTYFPSPADVTYGNEWAFGLQREQPRRVRTYVCVNPNYPDHALAEIERGRAAGAVGIKLAASRRATDPLLDPICAAGA